MTGCCAGEEAPDGVWRGGLGRPTLEGSPQWEEERGTYRADPVQWRFLFCD